MYIESENVAVVKLQRQRVRITEEGDLEVQVKHSAKRTREERRLSGAHAPII